ncbi:uncharacterized protein LOC110006442 [Amborella trichopoda]|nr:uncharacterized protein LOC110006442 [Amborella trichopoda]|eukprot:XP_020517519.1 uncharacterized protein LOC110006442 [Amborella trichopoda]
MMMNSALHVSPSIPYLSLKAKPSIPSHESRNTHDLRSKDEICWAKRAFSSLACVALVGFGLGFSDGQDNVSAYARERLNVISNGEGKTLRWSERRKCPQWHMNSLERIVPENLPRAPNHGGFANNVPRSKSSANGESTPFLLLDESCFSL